MAIPHLERIEANIAELSLAERLCMLEHRARHIYERMPGKPLMQGRALIAMTNDLDVEWELQQINGEFANTETDGFDRRR